MRIFLIASMAVLLAGCGQQAQDAAKGVADAAKAAAAPVFPNLNLASYKVEATMTDPTSGRTATITQYRSGGNVRMEMPGVTTVLNAQAGEAFSIMNAGGRQMAMRVPISNMDLGSQLWQADTASLTFVGPCTGAGEIGTEWAHVDAEGARSTGCVTADGILLRGASNGKTTWETTSVQRGPQDPALFAAPAGVQVMDLGGMAAKLGKAQ